MKDYYSILGVKSTDTYETIKAAYRRLALQAHPDKGNSNEAFQELHEAWSVLSDSDKRANYDKQFLADDNVVVSYEFPFSEFNFRASEGSFVHYCRCGGVFEIYQEEVDEKMTLIECTECSLVCRINYDC